MLHTITDELIRQFYPNVLLPAKGEQPISLKLQPYLEAAEEWGIATFLSSAVAEFIVAEHADVDHIVLSIVIHEGMRRAIPELDLVLTPNGFGIVSSSSIAPASRERVERLIAQSVENRDLAIEALLRQLPRLDAWHDSECAAFFMTTLFPNLNLCRLVGKTSSLWENYVALRSQVMAIEERLAVQFVSHELLDALRRALPLGLASIPYPRRHVVHVLRSYVAEHLRGGSPDIHAIVDLVDFIRKHADDFPEWCESETALLFSPPVFENKKESTGYWF